MPEAQAIGNRGLECPPNGSGDELSGHLSDLRRLFSMKRTVDDEDQVYRSLLEAFGNDGRSHVLEQLPPTQVLCIIRAWDRRLANSLRREVPHERVLCTGFAMEDTTLLLNKSMLQRFLKCAAQKTGLRLNDLISSARTIHCEGRLTSLTEVVATLIGFFNSPTSPARPVLATQELRQQMMEYVAKQPHKKILRRAGGAPANMAYILRQLGLRVGVHWHYHWPELASGCPNCADRVSFRREDLVLCPVTDGNVFPDPEHPRRCSVILAFNQGLHMPPNSPRPVAVASGTGRVPFGFPGYTGPRRWRHLEVRGCGRKVLIRNCAALLGENGWPNLPVFGRWYVDGENLVYELADRDLMKKVGALYDVVLLGGLQAFREDLFWQPEGEDLRRLIGRVLRSQLRVLADEGVVLHAEMGDIRRGDAMKEVAEAIRGVVPSLSLNDGDLAAITSFEGTEFFFARKPDVGTTETLYRRYERAVHLADKLGLQELWVHGNDVDILLVKVLHDQLVSGVLRRVIANKMSADLLAKGIVVLALLKRSLPTMWRKSAKRLSPTLAAKGFQALIDLAWDYSEKVCPDDAGARMALFRQVVMQGFHYRRKGGGYALIVIPVMWPRDADLPEGVDPAGLGDMYSAIVSVF